MFEVAAGDVLSSERRNMFGFEMFLSVVALILFTGAVRTSAETPSHELHYIYACFESGSVRVDLLVDEDEAMYADFSKEEVVFVIPHLPQSVKDLEKNAYEIAKSSIAHCHSVLSKARDADPGAPLRQAAPDLAIHTRYEGEDGVVNSLFCLANHFYPPSINFTWTKNGAEVTERALNLRYRHNSDGTFHRISTLSFTPRDGDVYSCSVQHQASQGPTAMSWKLNKRQSSVSPAALFFGTSIVLCLMGIGVGAFFFTKQPN